MFNNRRYRDHQRQMQELAQQGRTYQQRIINQIQQAVNAPPANIESPANIFQLENNVMADLTNFNKEYRLYLTCRDTSTDSGKSIDYFNKDICQGNTKRTIADLDAAYAKLTNSGKTGSLDKLTAAVEKLQTSAGGTNLTEYTDNYNNILTKYNEIVKNRQSLDAKLAELYQIGDTTSNFYQKKLVSTSYTKILLTVLATSLGVIAFVVAQHKPQMYEE